MQSSYLRCALVAAALGGLFLAGCGRIESKDQSGDAAAAFEQLSQLPPTSPTTGTGGGTVQTASAQNLSDTLAGLIQSGQINVAGGVNAKTTAIGSTTVNFTLLNQILSSIGNGQATSVLGLVNTLIQAPKSGNFIDDLNLIVSVLQQALPIITPIAPKLVPVVNALLTIIPLVEGFLKLLPQPTPTPSAAYWTVVPPMRA